MNRTDTIYAARDLADDLGVDDDQAVDTLASDELFAAYAYLYKQADLYVGEVADTAASATMKSTARCCAADARDVATERAEELLGDSLDREANVYRGP